MTVNIFHERHRRHAGTWPSDHQVDLQAIYDHIKTACPPQQENSISSQTLSSENSGDCEPSIIDHEAKEEGRDQILPHQDVPPPDEKSNSTPIDATSNTPNARASRLFRERRKEREKILRETIAELTERNMAMEALLLRHGILPPHAITLRSELSIHRSQRLGGPPIHIPGVTTTRPAQSSCLTGPNHHQTVLSNNSSQFSRPHEPLSTHSPLVRASSEQMQHSSLAPQTNFDLYNPVAAMKHGHPSHARSTVCADPPTRALDGLFVSQAQGISPAEQRLQHDTEHKGRFREPKLFDASFQGSRSQSLSGASDRGCLNTVYPFHQPHVTAAPDLISPPNSARSDLSHHGHGVPRTTDKTQTHTRAPSDSALLTKNPALALTEQEALATRSGTFWPHLMHPPMHAQALHDLPVLQHPLQPHLPVFRPRAYRLEPQSQQHDAHVCLQGSTVPFGPISAMSSIETPLPTNRATSTRPPQNPCLSTSASTPCPQEHQGPGLVPSSNLSGQDTAHAPTSGHLPAHPAVTSAAVHGIPHPERNQLPTSFPLFPPFSTQHQAPLGPEPQSDPPAQRAYIAHSMVEGGPEADTDPHADGQMPDIPMTPRLADVIEIPSKRFERYGGATSSPVTLSVSLAKSI